MKIKEMFRFDFAKFLFARVKPGEFVAMELGASNLKLSHIRVSVNKKEIANLANENVTGKSDADIAKVILNFFQIFGIKNLNVVDIIPSHLVITKNIEVPTTNEREIREIVNLQAGRHTPYSREEIIADYIDIGVYKRNYTKILLVIVPRSLIKRHFDILAKAGLKLEKALFAPEGNAGFVSRAMKAENQDSPVSLLHIDENSTDFTVVHKQKAVFVRSIPIGSRFLSGEPEKYQAKFAEELKKSQEAYQAEDIEKIPGSVILTGALPQVNIETALKEALLVPVKDFAYLKGVQLSEPAQKVITEARGVSFLNITWPLANFDNLKVDLVPEETKLRRLLEQRSRDLLKTGILSFAILVVVFSVLMSNIYFKGAYLKKLSEKYLSFEKQAEALQADLTKNNLIKNYLFSRGLSLEVLSELYTITPVEVELNSIKYDDQGRFSLKGTAESMSSVFAFVDGLEKSKYFKEVKTKYTTKRKEGKKDVTDFEIACLLDRSGKR
ncbi:MAG: pilus assembly protein PilM [Candidatus Omnitrophica bacterium]|nr:pilus assembly protein PilM [Candidatus Omnitrophota bacterium]